MTALGFAALLSISQASPSVADVAGQQLWLGGEDPITIADKHRDRPADFMALFEPDSPWRHAASATSAFKISMQFATRASDAQLSAVIANLKQRGIALAIETGMLRNDRGCGKGEGYIPADSLRLATSRIKRLGGRLDDVAMDEVVFFGREKTWADQPGRLPCRDSIDEIVREVAARADQIHADFPQAQIGDVEPISSVHDLVPAHLVRDYIAFADRYRSATGSDLAFFHADVAWRSEGWRPAIAPLKAAMRTRRIRFGIIIGGDPSYTDDVTWTSAGLDRLREFEANVATRPDDVIIQSWQPLPTHYLPEATPGTSTWMLLQAKTLLQ